jgi:HlyD family secretion protein
VHFSVQTYPNRRFTGTVRQVRLQSKTVENVVNYPVVIEVENPEGKLLPGMTANVDFQTGSRLQGLTVPNAALRFRPNEAMIAEMRAAHGGGPGGEGGQPGGAGSAKGEDDGRGSGGAAGAPSDGGRRMGGNGSAPAMPGNMSGGPGGSFSGFGGAPGPGGFMARMRANGGAMLWRLDPNGKLAVVPVKVGLSDGQRTEVSGEGLTDGMQIIIGVTQTAEQQPAGSPFQAPASGGGRGFRPGGV